MESLIVLDYGLLTYSPFQPTEPYDVSETVDKYVAMRHVTMLPLLWYSCRSWQYCLFYFANSHFVYLFSWPCDWSWWSRKKPDTPQMLHSHYDNNAEKVDQVIHIGIMFDSTNNNAIETKRRITLAQSSVGRINARKLYKLSNSSVPQNRHHQNVDMG